MEPVDLRVIRGVADDENALRSAARESARRENAQLPLRLRARRPNCGSSANSARPEPGDPHPGMLYFVSKIQCDEQRSGAFKKASIIKRAGIDGAHARNRFGKFAYGRPSLLRCRRRSERRSRPVGRASPKLPRSASEKLPPPARPGAQVARPAARLIRPTDSPSETIGPQWQFRAAQWHPQGLRLGAKLPRMDLRVSIWAESGTVRITIAALLTASGLVWPVTSPAPACAAICLAAACALSRFREPISTRRPAFAKRRARPASLRPGAPDDRNSLLHVHSQNNSSCSSRA